MVKKVNPVAEPISSPAVEFKHQFTKMYEITDKIVSKILSNGGTLEQDSYVVREEFGEALAAGYRYLRFQGETSAQLRKAGHGNEEVDYALDMYKEFADVFMMSTSYCRHHEWTFSTKSFIIYRPIDLTLETFLKKVSEVLYRINVDSINEDYLYEFMEEVVYMIHQYDDSLDTLTNKIDKLYNKIFPVVDSPDKSETTTSDDNSNEDESSN